MKQLNDVVLLILLLISLSQITIFRAKSISQVVRQNAIAESSPSLKKLVSQRQTGCRGRPWICRQGYYPPTVRKLCCRNRCIDVFSDVSNCGFCGSRCRFGRQCCRGQCVNLNISRFNCGKCFNRCPLLSRCVYGMCGYGQPGPRPRPPKPPRPCPPTEDRPAK
ncbi:hypothetical protein ACFE04_011001 [Oxalis oulophora]